MGEQLNIRMHMGNGKDYKDEFCMVNGKIILISTLKSNIVRQCFREIKLESVKDTDWKL